MSFAYQVVNARSSDAVSGRVYESHLSAIDAAIAVAVAQNKQDQESWGSALGNFTAARITLSARRADQAGLCAVIINLNEPGASPLAYVRELEVVTRADTGRRYGKAKVAKQLIPGDPLAAYDEDDEVVEERRYAAGPGPASKACPVGCLVCMSSR